MLFLAAFMPLAFGAVHVWAYTAAQITAFIATGLCLAKTAVTGEFQARKDLIALYVLAVMFALLAAFQLPPLGRVAIAAISPETERLYAAAMGDYTQAPLSHYAHETLDALLSFVSVALVFFVMAREYRDKKKIERLLFVMTATGFIEAVIGLYGYFGRGNHIFGFELGYAPSAAHGTFVNRNHFAGYLGMCSMLSLGWLMGRMAEAGGNPPKGQSLKRRMMGMIGARGSEMNAAIAVACVTMMFAILFSLSRGGVLSAALAATAMAAATLYGRQRVFIAVIIAAASMAAAVSLWYGLSPLEQRFTKSVEQFESQRAIIWKSTAEMISDHPVTGTGFGTFRWSFERYSPPGGMTLTEHAHNDYLELAAETGIMGSAIAAAAFIYLLVCHIGSAGKQKGLYGGITAGALGAFIYMAAHSLVDFNMHIPSNAMTFAIIGALPFALNNRLRVIETSKPARLMPASALRVLCGILILSMVILSAASLRSYMAERTYPLQKSMLKGYIKDRSVSADAKDRLMRAIDIAPGISRYHVLYANIAFKKAAAMPRGDATRKALIAEAQAHYKTAISLNPSSVEPLALLASLRLSEGDFMGSMRLFNSSLIIAPDNYYGRLIHGISIARDHRHIPERLRDVYIIKALDELDRAITLNPAMRIDPSVVMARASIFNLRGDAESAVRETENLREVSPLTLEHHLMAASYYAINGRHYDAARKYKSLLSAKALSGEKSISTVLESLKNAALSTPEQNAKAWMLILLADSCMKTGRTPCAIDAYRDVLALRPSNADVYFRLGVALEAAGDGASALKEYLNAVKYNKGHAEANENALRLLKTRESGR